MGRNTHRGNINDPLIRVGLLETDVDGIDAELALLREAMSTNTRLLTGILVSVTTASVLMALNLILARSS